jgi:hypothetical protein
MDNLNKKAKCVNNEGFSFITIGKVYEIVSESRDYIVVKNDRGISKRYGKNRFNIIQEASVAVVQEKPMKKEKVEAQKTVVCKIPSHLLEFDKKYKVIKEDEDNYLVKAKDGKEYWQAKKRFE